MVFLKKLTRKKFWPIQIYRNLIIQISKNPFNVLGIETSCDDTGVAIVNSSRQIIYESIQLQHDIHEQNGGIVPSLAMKSHQIHLPRVINEALIGGKLDIVKDIDVIAVTRGPGLPGCLGIGLSAAKTLAAVLGKPLIGVHHMASHALTARLTHTELIPFPYLTILISGGHTLILVTNGINKHIQLGTTIDDSVGEAFDKIARLLKIPWLKGRGGGPGAALEQFAIGGKSDKFQIPIPMRKDQQRRKEMNFSFSGLKTCIQQLVQKQNLNLEDEQVKKDLAAGGVASNKSIRASLEKLANERYNIPLISPPSHLCTDNGVMIAWTGVERFREGLIDEYNIDHIPKWSIEDLSK
ncbi:10724_t:CDS:2 [Diversispora eburnea]|uniref:N(6)-L-threonylcarbamoyladenine synthase n=1 Tax=Diversispora eburnea TaxID=1213867 RepID=A0A9N8V2X5_9GLOM|nr:10724_t:CDS:2 [Diversispora eburnea]